MAKKDAHRKEVELSGDGVKYLTLGAKVDKRPLKNYMEKLLEDKAVEIKIRELEKVNGRK